MLNIDKLITAEIINDPYPYIVVDDLIDADLFQEIKSVGDFLANRDFTGESSLENNEISGYIDDIRTVFPMDDALVEKIDGLSKTLEEHSDKLLDLFPHTAERRKLGFTVDRPRFIVQEADVQGYIHIEHPSKILSLVLYLSPDENLGTQLYNSNYTLADTIGWKPNRAFLMCDNQVDSLHSVKSLKQRVVLAFFFYINGQSRV
jgi:hypothetical protein